MRIWSPTPRQIALFSFLSLAAGSLLLPACSDDSGTGPDGAASDADISTVDYGMTLWPCETPGQSCNPHNECAIHPICGQDKLCRPTKVQNCDDGLACTQDLCKGLGLCDHVPGSGSCVLSVTTGGGAGGGADGGGADGGGADGGGADGGGAGGGLDAAPGKTELRCFSDKEQDPADPCQICDVTQSQRAWSGANGGVCDDGSACTRDDYCQSGTCKGTYYGSQCADSYSCTEDLCDGKGGCLGSKLKSDYCLINAVCYKDGTNDPSGACNTCDVATVQSAWTPITNTCTIDSTCYKPGDKNALGCGECDPTKSSTAWSPVANTCFIDGACYKPGDKSADSCGECKPSASGTAWTPLAKVCLIDKVCYKDGDTHSQGCAKCDSASSGTSWTVTDALKCVASGNCVDKATSLLACGACGVACAPGETCAGGKCSCGSTTGTVGGGSVCAAKHSCDQTGTCIKGAGLYLSEISAGGSDYVAIKNDTNAAINVQGFTIYFDDWRGSTALYDFAFALPSHSLAAGATLYICEYTSCSGGNAVNVGKNIMYTADGGANTLLCKGTCSSTTVVDFHSYKGTLGTGDVTHGSKFTPGPSTGISISNENTHSYQRSAFVGFYPNFVQSDWKVAAKTK